jgi:hypothetical protein
MRRRSFLAHALLAPWAAVAASAAWLQSCGGDTMLATSPSCDGRAPMIGVANAHTHPACVPMAALNGGAPYTMTLEATAYAPHTHTFALSSADISTLKAGGSLAGTSSFDAGNTHQHSVTF